MMSAQPKGVGKIERLCKAPYELQYPFCFMGKVLNNFIKGGYLFF